MVTINQSSHFQVLRLCHATTKSNAQSIFSSGKMYPGRSGLFGAGIYFADCGTDAVLKYNGDGLQAEAIIWANVQVGKQLVVEGQDKLMNQSKLQSLGYDSVKGRSYSGAGWEYVVYDSGQVELLSWNERTSRPSHQNDSFNVSPYVALGIGAIGLVASKGRKTQ
jgi:hypothetical protein